MALLNDEVRLEIAKRLKELPGAVKLVFFKTDQDCETCDMAEALAREVAGLSDKLTIETYNLGADEAKARDYGVEDAPALVVEGPAGRRVRFLGLPAGYEFASFLESLKDAAAGRADLAPATRQALAGLKNPVHIQVFVTPGCPYCPGAVRTAHKLAVEFPQITSDMVEVEEFPELARSFRVQGVPKVVINEKVEFTGARPESAFAEAVLRAVEP